MTAGVGARKQSSLWVNLIGREEVKDHAWSKSVGIPSAIRHVGVRGRRIWILRRRKSVVRHFVAGINSDTKLSRLTGCVVIVEKRAAIANHSPSLRPNDVIADVKRFAACIRGSGGCLWRSSGRERLRGDPSRAHSFRL